eukprot:6455962-Amphidinium_carterae.1
MVVLKRSRLKQHHLHLSTQCWKDAWRNAPDSEGAETPLEHEVVQANRNLCSATLAYHIKAAPTSRVE